MKKFSFYSIYSFLFFFIFLFIVIKIFYKNESDKNVLHVYFWSNYIEESIIDDFEKETGIKVRYDEFDSNDALDAKVLSGIVSYDLIMPTANVMHNQKNAYHRLQKSRIPNIENVSKFIKDKLSVYSDADKYSVNFVWGTSGIGINVNEIKKIDPNAPVDSLAMIFNSAIASKFSKCGIYVLDAADELIPAALAYLRKDPSSTNKQDLLAAKKVLLSARPYIRKFTSSDYVQSLANGDACLVFGWSGDIMQAKEIAEVSRNGVEIEYFIPIEGSQIFFDQLVIPENAKNKDAAYKFIDFILRPEISARIINSLKYPTALFTSVSDNVDEKIINSNLVFPDEESMKRLYVLKNYDVINNRKINRIFIETKLGKKRIE